MNKNEMPKLPVQKDAEMGEMLRGADSCEGKTSKSPKKNKILAELKNKWSFCRGVENAEIHPWRNRKILRVAYDAASNLPHRETLAITDKRHLPIHGNILYIVESFVRHSGKELHHIDELYFTMPCK